jgi:hypothetical protein
VRAPAAIVLALLAAAPPGAASARAGTVPDSAARAALERQVGHLGRVRIAGPAGHTLVLKPVVCEDGLHMRGPWHAPRPALVVIGDVPAPPPPVAFVPWSEIDQVQVPRGDPGRGALSGAIFGAGLSAILITIYQQAIRMDTEVALPLVLTGSAVLVGTGALFGAVAGSYAEDWRTVYPAPPPPAKRRP